jgi:hypothetical protein
MTTNPNATPYGMQVRLIESLPEEHEWRYLLHETLIGERCIVPLLEDLAQDLSLHDRLRAILRRQIDEETTHVELYEDLIGRPLVGDGYAPDLGRYVRALPSTTYKLFAMQAVLESISLAAIRHRLDSVAAHPARAIDERILLDEEGHVRFGYAFLDDLKAQDGVLPASDFARVAHEVNGIFARHFNGDGIVRFFERNFAGTLSSRRIDPATVDRSAGMRSFRMKSARAISEQRREFVGRYER